MVFITHVEPCGYGDVWDFEVPGYGNYELAGVLHHNSGKSILGAAIVAGAARGKCLIGPDDKPLPPFRPLGIPQLIWVIGKGESHIGSTLYRLLFTPDQFPILRDPLTGRIRAARNWQERRMGIEQKLLSPPFIPEDEIEMIAFNKKAADYFDVVKLKNGTRIESYVSSGDVKMGDPVDVIWPDEDIDYPGYVNEWLARLPDKKGRFIWTAWPWSDNWALTGMSQRAKEQSTRESPDLIEIKLSFADNPFIDDDEKRKAMEAWGASGNDELRSRVDGEFAIGEKLMYPTFGSGVHGCPRDGSKGPADLLTQTLEANNWEPPKDWTRYLFYDPGHTTTAILFMATPPPDKFGDVVVAYDELYLHCLDAHQVAQRLRPKLSGVVFEDFVIDQRFSRQTIAALGRTQYEIFAEVWSTLGFRSVRSHGGFTFASDNKEAGCEAVRVWLTVRGDGTTKFRFIPRKCPNLILEMQAYRKTIVKEMAQDKPGTNQRDHLVDDLRYAAMHGCPYVTPPDPLTFQPSDPVFLAFQSHKNATSQKPNGGVATFNCGAGAQVSVTVR